MQSLYSLRRAQCEASVYSEERLAGESLKPVHSLIIRGQELILQRAQRSVHRTGSSAVVLIPALQEQKASEQ